MMLTLTPPASMTVFSLSGHINASSALEWQNKLRLAINKPETAGLVLDMGQVESLDSAGLMVLVRTLQLAKSLGRKFCLRSVSHPIGMILELSQLDRVFEIIE